MSEEAKIVPDCDSCGGKCCVGDIEVAPGEPLYGNEFLTTCVGGSGKPYDRVMNVSSAGKCICLVDGRCSIYESRPAVCRRFQLGSKCCLAFSSGEKLSHSCKDCVLYSLSAEDASEIAASAADSVEASFEDSGVEFPSAEKESVFSVVMDIVVKFVGKRGCQ